MDDQTTFDTFINDPGLPAFIGPNAGYYQERWRRGFARKRSLQRMTMTVSWNWAAFFLSIPWMLWRRMYGMATVLFIAVLVVQIMEIVTGRSYNGLLLAFALMTGVYGNGWYFQHALGKLHKAGRGQLAGRTLRDPGAGSGRPRPGIHRPIKKTPQRSPAAGFVFARKA